MRIFFLLLFIFIRVNAQNNRSYSIRTIAFYNVENLFDTINNPITNDDNRTPKGSYKWTSEKYHEKIARIAYVISDIGKSVTKTAPDIIGLAEIENNTVLNDLIETSSLINENYGVLHYDSPDERGIDVALLFKKAVFTPLSFKAHKLIVYNENEYRDYSRDQLLVSGLLDGEMIHFIVNHWPSRSGGKTKSDPKRREAALLNKKIIDSLLKKNPKAKIISMGDFNDDPSDRSFKKVLKTHGNRAADEEYFLYNPMEQLEKKGVGSLAHRDRWHLFDQLFFTSEFLKKDMTSFRYWKAGIFNPSYLITPSGRYKGYPYRSYSNGQFTKGYSDHFPVYLYLIKAVN
ncbi:endonuclease/exonuclease/phosphatase family protein [Leptobacterium sp. I13]|uniref:endonuclease/exonuclease/phosphatase family protein n=1 Tax=Leptobacterium meishanense TaxID=3128904 RepID=UPI0030ECCA4F